MFKDISTKNVLITVILTVLLLITQFCASYATVEDLDYELETQLSGTEATVRELNNSEKKELLKGDNLVNIEESDVLIREVRMDNGEKAQEMLAKITIDEDSTKGLPSGSTVIEEKSKAYITIKTVLGYQNIKRSGVTYSRGLFYGGKVVSQSNSVVVSSLKGRYHEYGAYVTIGGQTGITAPDYIKNKTFKVSKRYQWQYDTVDRDRYYSTTLSDNALEAKFTVKGTQNGNSFTIALNATRI